MSKYYQLIENEDVADLYIFGDISAYGQWWEDDPSRSAYNIVNELKEIQASNVNVHINSYGGDVSEGLAIYNTLKSLNKNVTTICDGFACSAASVVFCAGDKRVMSDSSLLMIHNAWTYTHGNSEALRKTAEDLDIITQASVNAYKLTANISEEEIKNLMDNESWITAESAVEMGFATDIVNKKEDGVNQSAFDLIKGKLLAEPEQKGNEPNWEELAEKVAEKVKALLPEEKEEEEKVHEDVEQQQLSGWEAFFK